MRLHFRLSFSIDGLNFRTTHTVGRTSTLTPDQQYRLLTAPTEAPLEIVRHVRCTEGEVTLEVLDAS